MSVPIIDLMSVLGVAQQHSSLGAYLSNAATTAEFTRVSPVSEVRGNVGSLFRTGQ